MVLKSTYSGGVSVYHLSGGNSQPIPEWIARKRRRDLRQDSEYSNRIELIQDFSFSEASNRIKVSNDGNFIMATGTYKPQIHVYDLEQMSLKFERHTDSENVDFELLSDDYTKSIHLMNDRTIELHAKGGIHTKTRIPKFGRAIKYHFPSCDAFIAATGDQVYRLNLEQGRFMNPYEVTLSRDDSLDFSLSSSSSSSPSSSLGVNAIDINPLHGLVSLATDVGTVEFWDPRVRKPVGILASSESSLIPITAIQFRHSNSDPLTFATGCNEGIIRVYDLRSPLPLIKKDQGYGIPIKKLNFIEPSIGSSSSESLNTLSADSHSIKIWNTATGKPFASMEPGVDINDVAIMPGTGMIFTANEGPLMNTYYIPSLGPAPKWCSFLDNITEELEESATSANKNSNGSSTQSVYENYKFVTRPDLTSLGLDHLIGTKVVRPYMHGYFIDQRLYEQARLIANPYAYEEFREREIKKRIDKERESRIRSTASEAKKLQQRKVKVNASLAEKISKIVNNNNSSSSNKNLSDEETENKENDEVSNKDAEKIKDSIMDRFKDAFEDPDFAIEEEDELNKFGGNRRILREKERPKTAAEESDDERFELLEKKKLGYLSDEDDNEDESDNDDKNNSSDEDKIRKESKKKKNKNKNKNKNNDASGDVPEMRIVSKSVDNSNETFEERANNKEDREEDKDTHINRSISGAAEMSFTVSKPVHKKKVRIDENYVEDENDGHNENRDGRKKQRYSGRRSASKNTMYKMR